MNRIFVWTDRDSIEEHRLIQLFKDMKLHVDCYLGGYVFSNVNGYYFETEDNSFSSKFMKKAMNNIMKMIQEF